MRKTLMIAAVVSALGCSGDGMVGSSTVNGTYTLRSVNGSALPYTVTSAGTDKTEILDDAITLYEGFTYEETAHLRVTANAQATTQTNHTTGSFALLGNSISLRTSAGVIAMVGVIEGNTMTIPLAGITEVFKK
jgi:hypothetical protein